METFKIKLFEGGKIPVKATASDAGYDCFVRDFEIVYDEGPDVKIKHISYKLGFALEMPEGWATLIFQRSSVFKYDLILSNAVGVVDSGYRGELQCIFKPTKNKGDFTIYNIGDRVCQIIPYKLPEIKFEVVEELSMNNDRGGGFGSTGK